VISAGAATKLNEALGARGIEVLTPDLEIFTLGGGGAHCLGQALSRELLAG
jgi:N-dimethylarginine dimethylaminohydrolase